MKVECPKCSSQKAWYERNSIDIVLRCMCGYNKTVFTRLKTIVIETSIDRQDVKLPRADTHLHNTLMSLVAVREANSQRLTQIMVDAGHKFTVSDVSSYLTILKSKGLVFTRDPRRGLPGGSLWELTDACRALTGV